MEFVRTKDAIRVDVYMHSVDNDERLDIVTMLTDNGKLEYEAWVYNHQKIYKDFLGFSHDGESYEDFFKRVVEEYKRHYLTYCREIARR